MLGGDTARWRGAEAVQPGGSNTQHCFNDTWCWTSRTNPSGRERRGCGDVDETGARDDVRPPLRARRVPRRESLFVFGGCHISDVANDL